MEAAFGLERGGVGQSDPFQRRAVRIKYAFGAVHDDAERQTVQNCALAVRGAGDPGGRAQVLEVLAARARSVGAFGRPCRSLSEILPRMHLPGPYAALAGDLAVGGPPAEPQSLLRGTLC